ncbi:MULTISPECIES: hypothetical protein [unclassified Pseudodesulfovibrio]|uniref:hypothetical protein n=1 Tax=unclassified Pseudodesulfovibrio TaxID=2661612 RepID=UPI000FEBF2EC|nr:MULTISPECIES: hypothetical protein [unclassified Pseudodesulfovibrio]MCJ2164563.1 hypothetical protein [Pseudodesulfovibrio sp. S3-i]RWU04761.1 hypothetical protein DWB63_08405 [Pseudodesulfovibrio sp. S3]
MPHKQDQQKNTTETIRGMVLPQQWDEQFRVTEVLIACKDEREIRVENFENLPNLLSLSRAEAVFTGVIRTKEGVESMIVESFTPIENTI